MTLHDSRGRTYLAAFLAVTFLVMSAVVLVPQDGSDASTTTTDVVDGYFVDPENGTVSSDGPTVTGTITMNGMTAEVRMVMTGDLSDYCYVTLQTRNSEMGAHAESVCIETEYLESYGETIDPGDVGYSMSNDQLNGSGSWRNTMGMMQSVAVLSTDDADYPNTDIHARISFYLCPSQSDHSRSSTVFSVEVHLENVTAYEYTTVLSFNPNGGAEDFDDRTSTQTTTSPSTADVSIQIPSSYAPTRAGWEFVEWNTRADGNGTGYDPGMSVLIAAGSETTLFAKWEEVNTFRLVYDENSGSGGPADIEETGPEGSRTYTVSSVEPTRDGFDFVCWNTESDGTGIDYHADDEVTVYADVTLTLYAIWESDTVTVVYVVDGEEHGRSIVNRGQPLYAPTDPVAPEGYVFDGWYSDSGYVNPYLFGSALRDDLTLYGRFVEELYFESEPRAEINVTPSPDGGRTYTFSSSGSENRVSVLWDFGDGNTSTEFSPTHWYGNAGTYEVTLTVYNSQGESDTVTETIVVGDGPDQQGPEDERNYVLVWTAIALAAIVIAAVVIRHMLG